ncbi:class E sortase, partial [Streptomyces sp. 2MCAF27]
MRVRLIVRTLSEICLTVGTLIVLFVVYVLYWTGVLADRAMDGEIDRLQDRWATGPVAGAEAMPQQPEPERYRDGASFAIMYIPRFGADWAK